jgi:two-component system, OmpR family, response regulator ChvI
VPVKKGNAVRTPHRRQVIAVVNDEAALLEGLTYNLRDEGYEVRLYDNTADALELIERPADIALLDKSNYPFDGVELYRRLRQEVNMPIVFLSAWAHDIPDELRERQLPAAEGYISCPFALSELFATVKRVLNERTCQSG